MESKVIEGKPRPRGRYPHYKRAGDFIYVSGTTSRRADNTIAGAEVDELGTMTLDIRAQTRACIENIRDILRTAGAELADCVSVTTYLVDMGDFGGYNEATPSTSTTTAPHAPPSPCTPSPIPRSASRSARSRTSR